MRLGSALHVLAASPHPEDLSPLAKDLDPRWIEEALLATGTASLRKRRLPAEQVIWLVLGMALFRERSIRDIVDKLDLALPSPQSNVVAPSAIPQARERVGEAPLEWLCLRSGSEWGHKSAARHRWRGLALYGCDGTTLRVADSDANRAAFGLAGGGDRGESGYPVVRMVGLMAVRSHVLVAASFGPYGNGELTYADDVWPHVPDDSLTIVDRNYWSANVLLSLSRAGANRHWLTRAKKTTNGRRLERLGANDQLVELDVSPQARTKDPSLPTRWVVRIIRYQRKGFRPQRLITSLLDPERYPADEIVALYHERWELELAYDEVKTEMLENIPLRSKSPSLVRQEIWGLLIAYNLIRLEMERVADEANVSPLRISFIEVYRLICDEWLWAAVTSPGAIPQRLRQLRATIKRFLLPARRPRSYPRAVKVKMSNYAKKRPVRNKGRTPKRSK